MQFHGIISYPSDNVFLFHEKILFEEFSFFFISDKSGDGPWGTTSVRARRKRYLVDNITAGILVFERLRIVLKELGLIMELILLSYIEVRVDFFSREQNPTKASFSPFFFARSCTAACARTARGSIGVSTNNPPIRG